MSFSGSFSSADASATLSRADAFLREGQAEAAAALVTELLRRAPDCVQAREFLAGYRLRVGLLLGRWDGLDARARVEAASEFCTAFPQQPVGWRLLGNALMGVRRFSRAAAAYRQAISLSPGDPGLHNNLGVAMLELGRAKDAEAALRRALELQPDYAQALSNLGNALKRLGKIQQALEVYEVAVRLDPQFHDALYNLGNTRLQLRDYAGAAQAFRGALRFAPNNEAAAALLYHAGRQLCDWGKTEAAEDNLGGAAGSGAGIPPFALLTVADDPAAQLARARAWSRAQYAAQPVQRDWSGCDTSGRLRMAYFGSDFHNHATLYLMEGLLRERSRDAVELTIYDYGTIRSPEVTARVQSYCDAYIDASEMSDGEVVEDALGRGLQVAVDLKGYTEGTRSGILAQRVAPVQVSYLGYPGTMGAQFIDYIVADPVVIPARLRSHYSEGVIYLPHSYQPNDNRRQIAKARPTRAALGLPEGATVLCCFNKNYKISLREFSIWMRVLRRHGDCVLWLFQSSPEAAINLRREASEAGVEPERVIFAEWLPQAEHLARLTAADLFVDTYAVNAHTTASDALWAGVPVVTLAGRQFAARVGASLLHACGLPELVAEIPADYERLILDLAGDAPARGALRRKLSARLPDCPLFNTKAYARHFETGLRSAYEHWSRGCRDDVWVQP